MKLLFWLCFALIIYAYVGYAVFLSLWALLLKRLPTPRRDFTPTVSIVIAARNEEANVPAKLQNLRRLDYPQDKLEIVIASDGSTDRTASILREHVPYICPVILDDSKGKAHALNEAVKRATGEILVFLDARQSVEPNAVSELASCFADSTVGAVSGELLLETPKDGSHGALGIYWKIEKIVRKLESASGSVVGVTGAIYAIRRELYTDIPPGTILDDVFVPMNVARMGKRIVFQPSAIARDRLFSEKGKEFSRKVRTLTGNYQLLRLAPWLLSPSNPLLVSLHQPQTLAASGSYAAGSYAGCFSPGNGAVLSGHPMAPGAILRFSYPRNVDSGSQEVQAGGYRQHVRHAQCGRNTCVLQLCGRTKEGMALVS